MFETRGDDIERKICPEPETSMPDEQMNDNCDEAVSPEKDKNEPVIDLGTDSDKNSATDQGSTDQNLADQNLAPDQNNDQGSKVQCWNAFQGKWLTRGDAITEGSIQFDNIEDAIIECDRLGDANCQGILVKTGRSSFKLR